jgi:hypothetical protein
MTAEEGRKVQRRREGDSAQENPIALSIVHRIR